jgi:hypothetical protein
MSSHAVGRALLVAAMVFTAVATGSGGALAVDGLACRVKNVTLGQSAGRDLQAAINAARSGDTLRVSGVCVGSFLIDKSLVLTGRGGGERATLTGAGVQRVLDITGTREAHVAVVLRGLRVVHGRAPRHERGGGVRISFADVRMRGALVQGNAANRGGGLFAHADLTLVDTRVTDNEATDEAGGILSMGRLRLRGRTSVDRNSAVWAAGIMNRGPLTLWGESTVSHNKGRYAAGIAVYGAPLVMNGHSSVKANGAVAWAGIFGSAEGVVLNDRSLVRWNRARDKCGGIFGMGPVVLNDHARVVDNAAGIEGGGIMSYAVVHLNDEARVDSNVARRGAGIEMMDASLILRDRAQVSYNIAGMSGGGVLAYLSERPRIRILDDSSIQFNNPNDVVIRDSKPLQPPQA